MQYTIDYKELYQRCRHQEGASGGSTGLRSVTQSCVQLEEHEQVELEEHEQVEQVLSCVPGCKASVMLLHDYAQLTLPKA